MATEDDKQVGNPAEPAVEPLTVEQIEDLKQKARERDEIWDRFLRTAAEYENRRKRLEADAERRVKYALQGFLEELAPVLSNLSQAVVKCEGAGKEHQPILDGIRLIEKRFYDVLASHNVRPIRAVGEKFDPNVHEAVSTRPTDKQPEGTVVEELERGWTLDDRVVKAAKVIVAVAPTAEEK